MKKRINYRHFICIAITLGFIAISIIVFPHALGRVIEGARDLGLSVAYFFCELFGIPHGVIPTVNSLPKTPFFPFLEGYGSPITSLPETWNGFTQKWHIYWGLWANKDNFLNYLVSLANLIFNIIYWVILVGVPVFVVAVIAIRRYNKKSNNDYGKESKPLIIFKRISDCTYHRVKRFVILLITFIKTHKAYWVIWLCLWLYNFNAFAVILEFFAYYIYFAISFDVASLYLQFYKLALDLWAVLSFVPLWAWFIIGFYVLYAVSISRAYQRLYHYERRNRGFLNSLGTVRIVYGSMGAGKTTFITDMALSDEMQFLTDALEIILETDMKFPFFPWITFENSLKRAIHRHSVYDLPTCRRFVRSKYRKFMRRPLKYYCFGYDFERYGLYYNDKLKLTYLWEALEDYACAYFIYTVQSSYIIANYSIRSDKLISDLGNFPLWDTDFFKRDSRLLDSFSRHAHILDFDMLRLGKQILDENPNRNAFGFGIYVISEIDKERKNTVELKEIKATAEECNQKNDLFNVTLKMSRHACVVANRVFDRFYGDLQRPSSLGADALDLGELCYIEQKGEMSPVLPFYSPFWLFDLIFGYLKNKFDGFYLQSRYKRSDNTLFLHIVKTVIAKFTHYYEGICNLFSSQTLALELERGSRDGKVKQAKWYRMPKKIYSNRFSTDGHAAIFEARAKCNSIGIEDLKEYEADRATAYEMGLQNSHFWREISNLGNTVN